MMNLSPFATLVLGLLVLFAPASVREPKLAEKAKGGKDADGAGKLTGAKGGPAEKRPSAPTANASRELAKTAQFAFIGPVGMKVAWDVKARGRFDSEPLVVPGRYNFPKDAIYRLKLFDIPGHRSVELYPTLEIGPSQSETERFLELNAIPVDLTDKDLDQVAASKPVTKVICLPRPEFQELSVPGLDTFVSTLLDPGVDPVSEAAKRGSILAILRLEPTKAASTRKQVR